MPTSRKLLNLKEVSAILNMNTEVLRRWLRNGKLPGVKVGSDWRVNAADLESFVNPAGNKNAASKNESPKKMCFRFPKWLEFSGLPRLLNDKIGPEAWPVFKKLIELDFELGKPSDRHVILDRVELSERTGYDEQVIEAVMALLEQNGLIRLKQTVLPICLCLMLPRCKKLPRYTKSISRLMFISVGRNFYIIQAVVAILVPAACP